MAKKHNTTERDKKLDEFLSDVFMNVGLIKPTEVDIPEKRKTKVNKRECRLKCVSLNLAYAPTCVNF